MQRSRAYLMLVTALGAVFLPTLAQAAGWIAQDSSVSEDLYDVSFSSAQDGVAVGRSVAYTNDSGASWHDTGFSDIIGFSAVDTYSSNVLAVGGLGYIQTSADKGVSWTTRTSGTSDSLYGADVYRYAPEIGAAKTYMWAAGNNGTVLYSDDLGVTWDDVSVPTSEDFYDIHVRSSDKAMVVGSNGTLYGTEDGGANWTDLSPSTSFDLLAIDEYSGTIWVAGEGEYLASTTNSGATWNQIMFTGRTILHEISDIDFTSATIGHMVRTSGGAWYTTNGGSTWTETSGSEDGTYNAISSPATNYRYAVGDDGLVYAYDATAPSAPTSFAVFGGSPTTDTTPRFTWTAGSDTQSDITYEIQKGSGTWTDVGDVTTYTWPIALALGTSTFSLRAIDEAGNLSSEVDVTVTITAVATPDTTAPTVGNVVDRTLSEDTATTFSATYADAVGVTECTLVVDGDEIGTMTLSSGTASRSYTFTAAGTYDVYVYCLDAVGNNGAGTPVDITVTAATSTPDPSPSTSTIRELIKTACSAGADVSDPCRAVYYHGDDGKRHAFPNEKVFFTWYDGFEDVITVSGTYMASLTLGRNVTYHPGTKMVKFITVNTVYAVGEEGDLRAIDSETTAKAIYGSTWNRQIDDISDAFFGNYSFGEDIDNVSDYDASTTEASVTRIDEIL